jgi:hypothetical protein
MRILLRCFLAIVAPVVASAPALADFPPLSPFTAIEYYHAGFDHYFITALADEIQKLDAGQITGWSRTGRGFRVFPIPPPQVPAFSPVCRFYIPPQHGDSHFFSASPAECASILAKIGTDPNYSDYVEESANIFYVQLPDAATGACPAGASPIYRMWNQRADSNHRYTTDPAIKAAMLAKGYVAEGLGPDAVAMCTTQPLLVDALVTTSGLSPFTTGCDGVPASGTLYVNSEVEPMIAANPANPNNLIAVWQQDRWSNGGARGPATAYSFDGGGTWARSFAPMSRCAGGAGATAFERASDPWVSFAPDGKAYQISLSFNDVANGQNAILVSRSADGGRTWSGAVSLRSDGGQNLNDKESITADPADAHYVYATWERVTGNNAPTWFARTTDGGASWEAARSIYDPGPNRQTLNNQVVVLPDGTLILFFSDLPTTGSQDPRLRILRSTDKGATWSAPINVADLMSVGTADTETGIPVRDGSGLGAIAAGPHGELAVAWQDSRFSQNAHDGIAFTRSVDGGLTWSAPIRINGAPAAPALLPSIAIRGDGTIGVAYYDLRNNTPDPATFLADYWLATSADGTTWSERHIDGPFDLTQAPQAEGYFLGDYMGLASVGSTFLPLFGRTTSDPDNRTNILVSIARPSPETAAAQRVVVTGSDRGTRPTAAAAERIGLALRGTLRARQRNPPATRE